MERIYSKVDPSKLLHIVVRSTDFVQGRQDIIEPDQYIQCSTLNLEKGKTFKPHKHIFKEIDKVFPQESWCLISGRVKCIFYDIDDTIITTPILEAGDASFSLGGGHNYEILEEAKIFEYKVGPYFGIEKDKIMI